MGKISVLLLAVIFILGWIIYFIPTFIAFLRQCKKIYGIAVLNIFLGWSFFGWVAALIWAVSDSKSPDPAKSNRVWLYIIGGCAVLGTLGIFGVYTFLYNKSQPDYEKAEPAYSLATQDLYQAFVSNKVSASAKYNGMVVALQGKLSKIEVVDTMVTAVFVFKQGMFGDEGIRCTMLKKFNDAAKKLQPDGEVKIKGYCTGFNDTDIIFEKCSILNQQ